MRVTRNNICKAILEETGLSVKIERFRNDYFYFWSEDEETDLMLNRLTTTTVMSNRLAHQSIEMWVKNFKDLIEDRKSVI